MKAAARDARLARVTLARVSNICLALPEVTRELQGSHARFVVAKKPIAYYLNNHHGDEIISLCCKVLPGDNTALIAADGARFYLPAYIGPRGWVGLRLDTGAINWEEVADLITGSYQLIAPKRLAARVSQG